MMNQPYMGGPQFTPPAIARPSPYASAFKIIGAIIALLIALLLGLIVLLLIGTETGLVGLIIGLVCATLPVPIYLMVILWIDRYEAEPRWMLTTAFLWGALVAVFVAIILNTIFGQAAREITQSDDFGRGFMYVVSAPIVEESAKAFILFLFFFWKKDEFDGIVDGIVYAGMVGLGFAMTENVLYYGRAVQAGAAGLTVNFFVRGMMAPFSHPLFTSMTGIGLGWSRQSDNGFVKVTMPVLGFMFAMIMHATWNGFATFAGPVGFFAAYFIIMGPVFIATLMVIHFALRREGRIVREYLYADCQNGLFDPHEYEKLCSIRGRMGLSWNEFWGRGFSMWRARMHCNQLASELAFHRNRVARGVSRDPRTAQEREVNYLRQLQELRRQLGLNVRR